MLALYKNTYVFGIFDSSREFIPPYKGDRGYEVNGSTSVSVKNYGNSIFLFGCGAGCGISVNSNISKDFTETALNFI